MSHARRLIQRWWNPRKNAAKLAAAIMVQRCDYAVFQAGRLVVLWRQEYRSVDSQDIDRGGSA